MENYKKMYTEALERSRYYHSKDYMLINSAIENIFPELKDKESEDEKMWKLLKKYVHYNISDMTLEVDHITRKEFESWLEKQIPVDKEEVKRGALKYVAGQFMKWLDTEIPNDEMCLSDAECKVIEDAFLKEDWATVTRYMREKHEEQDPCIGCTNDKGCVTCENGNLKEINIEPKFKPGDWVVDTCGYVWKIEKILNQLYLLTDVEGCESISTIEWANRTFHLWTNQDAKDGDVLSFVTDEVEWILIYKEIVTSSSEVPHDILRYYFLLSGNYCNCEGVCAMVTGDYEEYLNPATKEQRELLFKKMKEDGWKWDAEKKKLKKIQ